MTSPVRSLSVHKFVYFWVVLSLINVCFVHDGYGTAPVCWLDNYFFIMFQKSDCFVLFFGKILLPSLSIFCLSKSCSIEQNTVSSWNGPTGLKDDLTCVQKDPLIGLSFLAESLSDSEKNNWSLTHLLKISRSWIILPMSGAPGVGQKPSPFWEDRYWAGEVVTGQINNAFYVLCIIKFMN